METSDFEFYSNNLKTKKKTFRNLNSEGLESRV
ncbi:hypothetical protein SAMN04489723_106179 [Algoriphagus aquimarinus]|uniref:Uncharacterized protein n=1 Tax=Algoriphagus aquimarinus TaxID=237018 RepID=A0A1I0ZMA5_9BACT|nr:hypothetical protein SAMN04489723_106179 [Algoriphagus aquimarinus]